MTSPKKTIRYYYWLTTEFVKKNVKLILLTFFLSFVLVVGLVTIYPFLESQFFVKKQIIGLVGKYDINNLPREVTSQISNGLVFIKSDGSIIPALGSSWEIKNNGRQFLIHLKQNLIWNNGKKFLTRDINYQFTDVQKKIIDDSTIEFTLKNPLPIFISYLNKPIIKQPLLGVGGLYRTGKVFSKTGLVKDIYLIPNKKGIPTIIYKFYDNEEQLITSYKKGEITEFSLSNKSLIEPLENWKNTKIIQSVDYSRLFTLFFNFKNNHLKERDIRSAIRMGSRVNPIKDYGQLANGPIPPTSWAFSKKIKPTVYDPDTAKKIISNSLPSTESARLKVITFYEYADLAELLVKDLKNLGFKADLKYLTQGIGDDDFDLLLAYWKIPEDPDQYYFWHSTQNETNIGNFKNLKVDKLLEDGRSTFVIKERVAIYSEFQKAITDDPPAVFLFYPHLFTVKRK